MRPCSSGFELPMPCTPTRDIPRFPGIVFAAVLVLGSTSGAAEPLTLAKVEAPPPITLDEPLARGFSLERAAQSLDTSALHWQKTRKCAACHTLPPYLMARSYLNAVSPEPPEVRLFFETI